MQCIGTPAHFSVAGILTFVLQFEEEEEGSAGVELVSRFIPTLLTYLGGKVRALGERAGKEGGNLQLEFSVLSR